MLNEVKSRNTGRKIISFMHLSLDGFVAGPNGEMNRSKVDEEIFDHVPFSRQLYKNYLIPTFNKTILV